MKLAYKSLVVLVMVGLFCSVAMARKAKDVNQSISILIDRNITQETSNVQSRNAMAGKWILSMC